MISSGVVAPGFRALKFFVDVDTERGESDAVGLKIVRSRCECAHVRGDCEVVAVPVPDELLDPTGCLGSNRRSRAVVTVDGLRERPTPTYDLYFPTRLDDLLPLVVQVVGAVFGVRDDMEPVRVLVEHVQKRPELPAVVGRRHVATLRCCGRHGTNDEGVRRSARKQSQSFSHGHPR